ncbi:hypothetical protein AHIS2_p091 [Acaryochloris phage A-HIS2]|nr:hypothetical protein AHIS2_p091 [Acaryochloris phage A-HIS2]
MIRYLGMYMALRQYYESIQEFDLYVRLGSERIYWKNVYIRTMTVFSVTLTYTEDGEQWENTIPISDVFYVGDRRDKLKALKESLEDTFTFNARKP